jgi:O-antigen ligase
MSTHRRRLNWEAFLLAFGAGLAALQIQPPTASWKTYLIAFGAAALPVLALHLRHRQSQKTETAKVGQP